jgi:hypothetical protein
MSKYMIVKCPRCMSISQLHETSIFSDFFLCPVCSEGEIHSHPQMQMTRGGDCWMPFAWDDLIIICLAS